MSYSYDPTQLTANTTYQIRLEIADTAGVGNVKAQLLQDEEIQWAVTQERNFWAAAARCAEMVSRGFIAKADVKLGRSLMITYTTMAAQYTEMARKLRQKAMGTVVPWAGGQFESDKTTYEQNLTLLQPFFTREMGQNPWVGGYTSDTVEPGPNEGPGP